MTKRHRNDGPRKRCNWLWRDWSKCPDPWYFSYLWKRHRYRISLDREVGQQLKGKTEATTAAETIKTAIRAGTFPSAGGSAGRSGRAAAGAVA